MLYTGNSGVKIFSCNSNAQLAKSIAKELNLELSNSEVSKFSDGEISVKIDETVRGKDVYVVQSTSPPVNDNIMELLIMIDALKRASAGCINAVIPYFGYARQDRKTRARDPISAKLIADLLTTAGANRILTMDLHCVQIQGFFNIPVDNLMGMPLFVQYVQQKYQDLTDVIVVSPDLGSVTRARTFALKLDVPLAIIDKRRPKPNVSEVVNIIGSVEGKRVILVDDLIDTAGTICNAAKTLKDKGATEALVCATHGVLSGKAIETIANSAIDEMLLLDTVVLDSSKKIDKIKTLSVSSIFAEAIHRINEGLSVSKLFD